MPTQPQITALTKRQFFFHGLHLLLLVIATVWPTWGPPQFRYTGSNPDRPVWNFGYPVSAFIFDEEVLPAWHMGPLTRTWLIVMPIWVVGVLSANIVWNQLRVAK
ncbi:hypothetical protein [Botrimarina mediterranea]|uniref:Uncharacterized protein n=1 Tax=Botrimarina mediterranea TaxID=2528022 RepID=A0A518KD28_9BACT|nr:hypothetical protein [Botrimarina mediterranea]QDV75694.1 hypothetical protein Spa11_39140 [Botrimarina mediterranea]QDV80329.1 hypothetical protein K2D_39550 [Planctomycetes bacterium K2D]